MKLLLIDVDGTLCGKNGLVPQSAKDAVRKAKEMGHICVLSTGRAKSELTDEIVEMNFDGLIGSGGGYVEFKDQLLQHNKFSSEQVKEITSFMDRHKIGYYLESNQGLFANQYCIPSINAVTGKDIEFMGNESDFNWFYDILNKSIGKPYPYDDVNKISFISNTLDFESIKKEFDDLAEVLHATVVDFGHNSGELAVKGNDKKTGIQCLLRHIGNQEIIAFGDGMNDMPMFEISNFSVAMKNAHPELIKVADMVTEIAEEDGIYDAFKRLKLI